LHPRHHRIEALLLALLVLLTGWIYLGNAHRTAGAWSYSTPGGYYNLLADALLSGQTHLKLEPDPRLLRLENPYDGPQGTDRPHDMSFYQGKFYLYYGIGPALLLFIPWTYLTGTYLPEIIGIAGFCFGSFVWMTAWLVGLRRRLFPEVNPAWLLCCVAVLAFGSPLFFLSGNNTFYAVPISAACFCLSGTLFMIQRCLRAGALNRSLVWLISASLLHGLAVASRPNYVLGLVVLLVPAFFLWKTLSAENRLRGPGLLPWLAAILPAAGVGVVMAAYNYFRFGSPFEFGIQYSLASADVRLIKLMGPEYLGRNFFNYLLQPLDPGRYYPFFPPGGRPFGLIPHFSLAALGLLAPLTWLSARLRHDREWMTATLVTVGAGMANLLVLSLFFGGEDRYLLDFVPPTLLMGCAVLIAALHLSQTASTGGAKWRRPLAVGAACLLFYTLLNGSFYSFAAASDTPVRQRIAAVTNAMVGEFERIVGIDHGPVEMKFRLSADRPVGKIEPLLTTGSPGGTGDLIYIEYLDQAIRLGFFHMGAGGPRSDPIPVREGETQTLIVHMGSLYPPANHPFFREWSAAQITRARRRLLVQINDQTAIDASVDTHSSSPGRFFPGANRVMRDVGAPVFSGTIVAIRRLTEFRPETRSWTGPVRLQLRFQRPANDSPPQPLISTGRTGVGDLLSVEVKPDGRARFIHDSWGQAPLATPFVELNWKDPQIVEVEMGSLYPVTAEVAAELRSRLAVRLGGRTVVQTNRIFHPSETEDIVFGYNAIGASSAVGMFPGTISIEAAAAQPIEHNRTWGPLRVKARFPTDKIGQREPLALSGVAGGADLIYVHYVSETEIRFGHDHWGTPAVEGDPVTLDYPQAHELIITMGSFYPAQTPLATASLPRDRPSRVEVRLNGAVVFSAERNHHPAGPESFTVGENGLGASSCGPLFTGEIITSERLAW